jgi:diguanylate cyclase (GGDEF)-like protein
MTAAPTIPSFMQADTRVILAGRTGLDAALRLDQSLELVRVSTLAELVAEVASPLPEQPDHVTAVVGDDLAREAGQGRVIRLCEQLRAIVPHTRILLSRSGDTPNAFKPESWGFDDAVGPESPSGDVRSMMRAMKGQPHQPEQQPVAQAPQAMPAAVQPAPTAPITPIAPAPKPAPSIIANPAKPPVITPPAATVAPSEPASASPGDAALVATMLRGGDITPQALSLLRERLNDATLEFVAVDANAPANAVRVAWDEAVYGWLRSSSSSSDELAAPARWLAGWFRLADQQAQLREAAFTDALTGANNRRFFDLFAARALAAARERRHYVTILLFDIDNFKQYNDLYGHEAGDDILVEVTRLMRAALRPTDRVCRLGGDEFAVIFHDPQGPRQEGSQHPADVRDIAMRFQKQVSEYKFPKLADKAQGTLTISGGLATFPWDGQTPAELLAHADRLLLDSKKAGKNVITLGPGALEV